MLEHATTGDGLLVGLHLLARMAATRRTLTGLASVVTKLPQALVNVTGVDKSRAGTDDVLAAAVRAAEVELGETGRVLLRPSGTQAMVRVMVEAPTQEDSSARRPAGRGRPRTLVLAFDRRATSWSDEK